MATRASIVPSRSFDEREAERLAFAKQAQNVVEKQSVTLYRADPAKSAAYRSVAPSQTKARIFKRGGRRPRPTLTSDALGMAESERITVGLETALALRLPLNRFITIHWQRQGVPIGQRAKATARYLKLARDALRASGQPFAYLAVRENDGGDGSKGDHVHILAHLPRGRSLGHLQRRWIARISGKPYRQGVILTRRVAGFANAAWTAPESFEANLAAVARYVLKGGSEGAGEALGLWRSGEGGRVTGQRLWISRNLLSRVVSHLLMI